jgi:hypothetical protein
LDIYKLLPHFVQFLGSPVFSGLAIVGGFAGLSWQEVRRSRVPESIPKYQLVHWNTKLPISSKPRIWPKIKLPVWVCGIAVVIAVPIWACYRTPLRSLVFVDKMTQIVSDDPTPPAIQYPAEQPTTISKLPTVSPMPSAATKSVPVAIPEPIAQANPPAHPTTATPPQPSAQPAPDSLAECPKEAGKLTGEWSINTTNTDMGGYNLRYNYDQTVFHSLFPLLQHVIGPQSKPLNSAQLIDAIKLSDEVRSHLPTSATIRINQQSISRELTLLSIRRSFLLNSDYLQYTYATHLPSGQDLGNADDKVLITSLSSSSLHTIAEFDQLAKSWGDAACKEALSRLTKPQ